MYQLIKTSSVVLPEGFVANPVVRFETSLQYQVYIPFCIAEYSHCQSPSVIGLVDIYILIDLYWIILGFLSNHLQFHVIYNLNISLHVIVQFLFQLNLVLKCFQWFKSVTSGFDHLYAFSVIAKNLQIWINFQYEFIFHLLFYDENNFLLLIFIYYFENFIYFFLNSLLILCGFHNMCLTPIHLPMHSLLPSALGTSLQKNKIKFRKNISEWKWYVIQWFAQHTL